MSKKVSIEVPIDAIRGECSCPIEWFEEWIDKWTEKGYTFVLKITDCNCVIKEISNMQELRDYVG